jgi:HAD superfamily hydrolase (TIGR01509 family)
MTAGGVLFDLDGVLVDSAALHVQAYERVFCDAGLSFSDVARSAVTNGKPRSHVIDVALPSAPPDLKQRLASAKPRALESVLDSQSDCSMPGATETVRELARAGVPMAVVTNSRNPQIWLRKIGISSQIKVVVAGGDISSPKPSPEGYLRGAELLNVEPECCLAIEDSYDGWLAATSAGMEVALVGGKRPAWLDADARLMRRLDASYILQRLGRAAARP